MKWRLTLSVLVAVCALGGLLVSDGNAQSDANAQSNDPAAAQDQAYSQVLAESIIARDEAATGRAFDPQYRAAVKQALSSFSPAELASIPEGVSPSALGDTGADLVFTPVTPCRVFDTRVSQGGAGPIPPGGTRNFDIAGTAACPSIPFGPATAVAINFVAVNPAGPGNLRVTPFSTPFGITSVINYTAVNIANGIDIKICNPATSVCTFDITAQADVSATDVLADVYGYFAAPSPISTMWAVVNATGTLARGFHAVSSSNISTGDYEVTFYRNVRNCAYVATIGLSGAFGISAPGEITVVGAFSSVNRVFVTTDDSTGASSNRGFHLTVHC